MGITMNDCYFTRLSKYYQCNRRRERTSTPATRGVQVAKEERTGGHYEFFCHSRKRPVESEPTRLDAQHGSFINQSVRTLIDILLATNTLIKNHKKGQDGSRCWRMPCHFVLYCCAPVIVAPPPLQHHQLVFTSCLSTQLSTTINQTAICFIVLLCHDRLARRSVSGNSKAGEEV